MNLHTAESLPVPCMPETKTLKPFSSIFIPNVRAERARFWPTISCNGWRSFVVLHSIEEVSNWFRYCATGNFLTISPDLRKQRHCFDSISAFWVGCFSVCDASAVNEVAGISWVMTRTGRQENQSGKTAMHCSRQLITTS
ncbi:MAG: hypothetical protein A4E42_01499 [Methanoregulaceae archaeon PtaU1.Bin222]|nr:MAG: hypothetical protein A4E42_01499 [Methanoregulaceae archaeon PtaU1.Bin222]